MKSPQLLIYLADDHEIVASGVAQILKSIDFVEEVRVYSNGKDLYKAVLAEKPNFIFLDIEMPEWSGIKTLEQLKINFPEIPVLMLSMLDEKSIIESCIKKGANGYLHKDSKSEELNQAITEVLKGQLFLSEETKKIVLGQRSPAFVENLELSEPMTERELEVLRHICDGLSSKEIGELLFVSHRTIETHKNNVMQKFGVNSTGKLISLAIKNKIIR